MRNRTGRDLHKFVLPLLIQYIASYLMGIADTAIVARLSTDAFNAVSLLSSTFSMLAGVFGAVSITLNLRLGNALKANNSRKFHFEFFSAILLCTGIGMLFFLLCNLFGKSIWGILYGLEGESLNQACIYSRSMSLYMLVQLLLFCYGANFKVRNNTKWILIGSTISSVINLVLDYFFVLGRFGLPQLGVAMAGWSNIIGLVVNVLIYVYAARIRIRHLRFSLKSYLVNIKQFVTETFVLTMQELVDGSVYTLAVNMILIRIGKIEYAAVTVINVLIGFLFVSKYLYGSAVLSMISTNREAEKKHNILSYPRLGSLYSSVIYCVLGIIIGKYNHFFGGLVTDNVGVLATVSTYFFLFLIAYMFSSNTYVYQCALNAIGESKFILWISVISNVMTLLLMFASLYLLRYPLVGIACAYFINETIVGGIFVTRFNRSVLKLGY